MKVLLITGSFPPMKCGVGDYTACLARALAKIQNTRVAVLTSYCTDAGVSNDIFEVFPVVRGWGISDISGIVKTIKMWRPDVIHIQYPTQGYGRRLLPWLLPGICHYLLNIPVVQTWHESFQSISLKHRLIGLLIAVVPGGLIVVRPDYKAKLPQFFRWLIRHKRYEQIESASTIPVRRLTRHERDEVRAQYGNPGKLLIAFFGFIFPTKGIEQIFDIADPQTHHLVLIGHLDSSDAYHSQLLDYIKNGAWSTAVTVTGFLPASGVGRVLSAADAIVLPFVSGGGAWNTSILAAQAQGTFTLTTAYERHGYSDSINTYYACPGDITDMRTALGMYIGRKNNDAGVSAVNDWETVAKKHLGFYESALRGSR
jgi:glycosyltransferase involved in cell wall biosynthesis